MINVIGYILVQIKFYRLSLVANANIYAVNASFTEHVLSVMFFVKPPYVLDEDVAEPQLTLANSCFLFLILI